MILKRSRSKRFLRKREKKHPVIALLGDSQVGKTCIAVQFCCSRFLDTYSPTIRDNFKQLVLVDNQRCMLQILDTAGNRDYAALLDEPIQRADGYLLVYDTTSRISFDRIMALHAQIQRVRGGRIPAGLVNESVDTWKMGPTMLVGTKTDLETDREVSTHEGRVLAEKLGCQFAEITNNSHNEVITILCNAIRMITDFQLKLHQDTSRSQSLGFEKKQDSENHARRKWCGNDRRILAFFKRLLGITKASPMALDVKPG
ncbi:NC-ras-2 protein [Thelonectria olida]|uniref:NC-ras-2 protein n=1 Tax=Thelonectria olida TaxID=1576542 RepID=A0A9P9ASR8_9HYPO|nr:NC-ras-2 protein [Thelonectria olida]